jgi:hypothetical protein
MVKTQDEIRQKVFDLGLKVKGSKEKNSEFSREKTYFFSSQVVLPDDLPNVEEALQILGAALRESTQAGLEFQSLF